MALKSIVKKKVPATKQVWWKEAVVYQIYPRSFKDSNGDGIGDINGITSQIEYLHNLGIDAIWLNPINESPNDDNGYDVSNYKGIMKEMGTMKDFDKMLTTLKKYNIKLIMDLVLNHSSDEHPWFIQSKSSRKNKYRNYYHWWPAEHGIPTPRYSLFDEDANAWCYDETTNSYYLHYFSKKQPDLNWENPAVRNEFYSIMKFWLDKGVSGFRLDAFPFMAKDTSWPKVPSNLNHEQYIRYYGSDKKIHFYLKEMYSKVFSKYTNAYTIGEGGVIPFSQVLNFIDEREKKINTFYHDDWANIWGRDFFGKGDYEIGKNNIVGLKKIINKWDKKLLIHGWNSVYLTNHDQSRAVSKFGNDTKAYRNLSATMLHTLLLTLRATPYIYNGDEIGMKNIRFKNIEAYNDLQTRNRYYLALKKNKKQAAAYLKNEQELSRDNSRTPMQWNAEINAGFTTGNPWLPLNEDYSIINVAAQEKDKSSVLNFIKQLIQLRKTNKSTLVYGSFKLIQPNHKQIFAYIRASAEEKLLVLLNFTKEKATINLSTKHFGEIILNNTNNIFVQKNMVSLSAYQAVMVKLL
jgi:oligo-1,6-glucosidase